MAIFTSSLTMAHSTDAEFRAWGAALSAALANVGLVKTDDTGQINWATALRPAANTAAGYEIWRWSDALQASWPIFLRLEYGSASGVTFPGVYITVGVATNGAGTISGAAVGSRIIASRNAALGGFALNNWVSYAAGCLSVVWNDGTHGFVISRTCDQATGDPSGDGCVLFLRASADSSAPGTQVLRFSAAVPGMLTLPSPNKYMMNPYGLISSLVGLDVQVYPTWTSMPRIQVLHSILGYHNPEITKATIFPATLITTRTYLAVSLTGLGVIGGDPPNMATAILWE